MEYEDRKHPARHPVIRNGNRSEILFVTVCAHQRKRILATPLVHDLLVAAWESADHWLVGRYVILPDHIHLFCAPAQVDYLSVQRWIAFWKSSVSKAWPNQDAKPIWQIDGWDRQLRKGDSYSQKWAYVRNNPVRHGLVDDPEDWPYQGELNQFLWHD